MLPQASRALSREPRWLDCSLPFLHRAVPGHLWTGRGEYRVSRPC